MCNLALDGCGRSVESYDFHGLKFRIVAEDSALLATIPAGMKEFRDSPGHDGAFTLDLHCGKVSGVSTPPAKMKETWRGPIAAGVDAVFYAGPGGRRIDLPGRLSADIDLSGNCACVCVGSCSEPWIFDMAILPAIVGCLRRSGQYPVHAACLSRCLDGEEPAAIILIGQSQAGKSTCALALARAGLAIQTDEVCVLRREGLEEPSRLRVWGLPRRCRIRPYTLQLLPWLQDYPLGRAPDGEELTVEPAALHGRQNGPRFGEYRPGLVAILDPHNSTGHVAKPIDNASGLMRIARENVRSSELECDSTAAPAFAVLASLVRQTPVCRLSVGPRLDDLLETLLPWGHW